MRFVVVAAALAVACSKPADCPSDHWDDGNVAVWRNSKVAKGSVRRGVLASCRDGEATRAFRAARTARAKMGALAPARVDVHVAPEADVAVLRIETVDGAILVASDESLPTGVWVHELVHVSLRPRPTPNNLVVARLLASAEEAVADEVAASLRLSLPERRKMIPRWASLAVTQYVYDPHPLGQLLSKAFDEHPVPAASLVTGLRQMPRTATTAQAAFDDWTEKTPAPHRPALIRALDTWLPDELYVAPGRRSR